MKAQIITGQAPGGQRTKLAEVLPLDTPLVVQIFPVYACNFRCNYCLFSTDKSQRGFVSDDIIMDFDLYKKMVDELSLFPQKLKVFRFVGMGEPLLHDKIVPMVANAVQKQIAERVEILTNGSLLTHQMSDALIAAGLQRLVVSLQGTSSEKYRQVCGANIDLEQFISNLRYFYENKGAAHVHLKVIDYALDGKEDEERFYQMFGDVCDTIGIETAGPIYPHVDYDKVLSGKELSLTQFGLPTSDAQICSQPYFTMQINPDGKVVPCYSIAYPVIIGDCHEESLFEMWKGGKFQQFRRTMLDGVKGACETCATCNIYAHRLFPEDTISSEDAARLVPDYSPT